ncbi:MAG: NAD-dependent protein deacylase [Clostridiales bacterium]|nr:NAD-dependent protein deacylase [Clostridiales bacterium]
MSKQNDINEVKIMKLRELIETSNNIVFFGGAGVSTESNIPDFRSSKGLYNSLIKYKYPPERMLSYSFFISHTKDFYEYYKNEMIFPNAKPNHAHKALAKLEKEGKLKAIITQNIDGLHQEAGSDEVLELHGSVHRNNCMECGTSYTLDFVLDSKDVPTCTCGGIVKPDVVLYEEGLDSQVLDKSVSYIRSADVLIVGGTSLTVYPAAGLLHYYSGNKLVLINKSTTEFDKNASLVINDSIGKVLKEAILN